MFKIKSIKWVRNFAHASVLVLSVIFMAALFPMQIDKTEATDDPEEDTVISPLKKGDQVVHAKFGEGIVLSCKNGIAEIAFPYPAGIKKIAAGHPSLKRKAEMVS